MENTFFSKVSQSFSKYSRRGEDLRWRGQRVRRDVDHVRAAAHGQGQPLLLQVQGGRGQVAGVGHLQVFTMNYESMPPHQKKNLVHCAMYGNRRF